MIVMPANATGWFWHCLARETGRIGHLFSPGAQRGPWPWFPFALDNGAFSCWNMTSNTFDDDKWKAIEPKWQTLINWAAATGHSRWAIIPDVPGNAQRTYGRWISHHQRVANAGIKLALAVQDGMTPEQVRDLRPCPDVICVGGTTEWKWNTVESWARNFRRVHLLRCNIPEKLYWLEQIGIESTDGTGWNRGNRTQTSGIETWARSTTPVPCRHDLHPYVCRATGKQSELFAQYR